MKTLLQSTTAAGLALIAAVSFLVPASVEAQINYQGILTDATGAPLPDGPTTVSFSLWDAATAGTKLWGDYVLDGAADIGHGPRADVVNGRFNVIIGPLDEHNASLTAAMDTDATLFLQIQVGANPITPRQAILATPRALMADKVRDGSVTTASLAKEVADLLCPPGSITAFGGGSAPDGWLLCDGRALDKDADAGRYQRLFAAIGTAWGDGTSGAGASADTDFNLPDLRGVFLRGVNGERSGTYADPDRAARVAAATGGATGNAVGSAQADRMQNHTHEWGYGSGKDIRSWNSAGTDIVAGDYRTSSQIPAGSGKDDDWMEAITDNFWTKPAAPREFPEGGPASPQGETRPANAYVNYIIKL
ncbi:MAG: tail fiber protein [Akkermansiaceae bacterium]|jgi:microcystin-dependent protein|nr:tail fiber protein [Akkermansiaceae bacterium]